MGIGVFGHEMHQELGKATLLRYEGSFSFAISAFPYLTSIPGIPGYPVNTAVFYVPRALQYKLKVLLHTAPSLSSLLCPRPQHHCRTTLYPTIKNIFYSIYHVNSSNTTFDSDIAIFFLCTVAETFMLLATQ
jgi:hypothetical protein